MYRFFIKEEQIHDGMIEICGSDVNHIKNVLRMKTGDKVYLSNGSDLEYECSLLEWTDDTILAKIEDVHGMETELPVKITLYQGLPKGDKMEMIVQKAVELGVAEIVPVAMKRCVVKLDAKKAAKKVSRWNTIALSAAKQAKRGIIPEVREVRNFKDILEEVQDIEKGKIKIPWYVIGFFITCALFSLNIINTDVSVLCKEISNKFEIIALAAIGLRVNVKDLIKQGKSVSLYGLFIALLQIVSAITLIGILL